MLHTLTLTPCTQHLTTTRSSDEQVSIESQRYMEVVLPRHIVETIKESCATIPIRCSASLSELSAIRFGNIKNSAPNSLRGEVMAKNVVHASNTDHAAVRTYYYYYSYITSTFSSLFCCVLFFFSLVELNARCDYRLWLCVCCVLHVILHFLLFQSSFSFVSKWIELQTIWKSAPKWYPFAMAIHADSATEWNCVGFQVKGEREKKKRKPDSAMRDANECGNSSQE